MSSLSAQPWVPDGRFVEVACDQCQGAGLLPVRIAGMEFPLGWKVCRQCGGCGIARKKASRE